MANRVLVGPLPGGGSGLRVSIPGYDVAGEPYGSNKIAFDSRFSDLGTVIAQGLCNTNQVVSFGPLSYVPIAMFYRIDPRFVNGEFTVIGPISGQFFGFFPYVGIVTQSTFQVGVFVSPYHNQSQGGAATFGYSIFAAST